MEQASPLSNTSPLPITTTPPVNPPSSNKSVLIILLVVFVIVLISLNAYLFLKLQNPPQASVASPTPVTQTSPASTPDPTVDWKSYTNQRCHIQIKYPSSWKVVSNCGNDTVENFDCIETSDFSGTIAVTVNTPTIGTAIIINCLEYKQEFSNEKLLQSCLKDKQIDQTRICKKVVFGGIDFIIQSKGSYDNFTNNFLYTINVEPASRIDTNKSTLDQILSTFKFLP